MELLRVPEGGHSAHDGMEIQIIDDDGYNAKRRRANQAKDYQHHGSLYFCVGAEQGYLRPAGEWNLKKSLSLAAYSYAQWHMHSRCSTRYTRSKQMDTSRGLTRKEGFIGLLDIMTRLNSSFKVKRMN